MDHDDDEAPVPCDICGECVPFNTYAAHSVRCSMLAHLRPLQPLEQSLQPLQPLELPMPMPSPWLMWYSAAAGAAGEEPVESQRRTWLTFLHFTNDAAGDAGGGSGAPRGLSSESIDAALGPVDAGRVGAFRRDDVCPVCLETFENRAPDRPLAQINQCGHVFCGSCINTWLAEHGRTCPVCKRSVGGETSQGSNGGGDAMATDAAAADTDGSGSAEAGTDGSGSARVVIGLVLRNDYYDGDGDGDGAGFIDDDGGSFEEDDEYGNGGDDDEDEYAYDAYGEEEEEYDEDEEQERVEYGQ